jgi:zinc transport system substrate-binding protein
MKRCAFVAVGLFVLAACGSSDDTDSSTASDSSKPTVAASFQPIEEIARRVAGDRVNVVGLTPPGAEAHDVELTAQELESLNETKGVVYLGDGFQPGVESELAALDASVARIDLLKDLTVLPATGRDEEHSEEEGDEEHSEEEGDEHSEEEGGENDPHVWLAPTNMVAMTREMITAMSAIDPDGAETFSANGEKYIAELTALDNEMEASLATCSSRTFVTNHQAFAYLANRYDLTQVPISGLSPDAEPSAQELEAIAEEAREAGVKYVFVEANLSDKLAKTLADELGLSTLVLQTVETLSTEQIADGVTYISAQRENMAALTKGLDCAKSS